MSDSLGLFLQLTPMHSSMGLSVFQWMLLQNHVKSYSYSKLKVENYLLFGTIQQHIVVLFVGDAIFAKKEAVMHRYQQLSLYQYPLSEELELFYNVSQSYDWGRIDREIGPKFKKAAEEFHREKRQKRSCPHKEESEDTFPQNLTLFDLTDYECKSSEGITLNLKGAGRKGQPFIAYLKAIELAPILQTEQNMKAIALQLRINSDYLRACGFEYPPSCRTLQDFDQIMSESGLWELFRDETYRVNVDDGIIKEDEEDTLTIDNSHAQAHSTPNKKVKECRQCQHFETCTDKVSTDETADWYVKSKCKVFYAHQVGMSQLSKSGAPFEQVVLSGRQYEPDSLEPLLQQGKKKHSDMDFTKITADGIFNTKPCVNTIETFYKRAMLYSPVNPKGRLKDLQNPARGIKRVTKHGSVECISENKMVFLTKDEVLQSYVFGCPVFNPEARQKLIHMGIDVSKITCQCKDQCCKTAAHGRIYRVTREQLKQVNWDMPQFSYRFHMVYRLRTKIERLFGQMKKRFKMAILYRRGVKNVEAHIDKFMALMHIVANVKGSYGV